MNRSPHGFLTLLGTGGSSGVPRLGCNCAICRSPSPRARRLRSAALCSVKGKSLLIDAGPDIRTQLLREKVHSLDALLITHSHADHIAGLDDLRPLSQVHKGGLPCYLSAFSLQALRQRFPHLTSSDPRAIEGSITSLAFHPFPKEQGEFSIQGLSLRHLAYFQGEKTPVNGFIFGDLAYLTDLRSFSQEIFTQLRGIKTLIVGATRLQTNPFHLGLTQIIAFSRRVGAEKTWLTHLSHEIDGERYPLPKEISFAYDGLKLPLILSS